MLEGITAPEEESDGIRLPAVNDAGRFLHELAVLVDPVAREIGAKIRLGGRKCGDGRAGISDIEERTRLRVADAEE